jgi:hypothetical protein
MNPCPYHPTDDCPSWCVSLAPAPAEFQAGDRVQIWFGGVYREVVLVRPRDGGWEYRFLPTETHGGWIDEHQCRHRRLGT